MNNDLLRWRQAASKDDWINLAKLAGTTIGYLDQIAYGNRRASPDMAGKIEKGTKEFPCLPIVLKEGLVFCELRTKVA